QATARPNRLAASRSSSSASDQNRASDSSSWGAANDEPDVGTGAAAAIPPTAGACAPPVETLPTAIIEYVPVQPVAHFDGAVNTSPLECARLTHQLSEVRPARSVLPSPL